MVLGRSRLDETGTILFLPELGQAKSRQDRSNLRIRLVLSGIHVWMALAAQHRDISGHGTLENGTARRSQGRLSKTGRSKSQNPSG